MAKTAIITGGSRGIGKAMALKFGELGYDVVINYVSNSSKAKSDEIAEQLKKDYGVDSRLPEEAFVPMPSLRA